MTLQTITDQFDLLMDAPDSVSKLRQFILQLAVQGKLTEQDPSDESAEVLLERIRSQKAQWLKENDSPRRRSLGSFSADVPFELSSKWQWTRLDDVSIYIQRGKSPDYAEIEEIPVVSQKCIQWEGFQSDRVRFIDPKSLADYQDYRFLRNGDLLWNSTGVGTVGRINVYRGELCNYRRVVADSHVTIVRPVKDLVLPDYVYCWIAGAYIQGRIDSNMTSGSTKQTELNTTTVRETVLPLPPLKEQHRIVATVDRLMDECDTLEAQQEAAAEVRVRCTEAATHALQTAATPAAVRTAWHRLRDHFATLTATPDAVDAVRQTILQLAVQGKLTEQDPSDEPASNLVERSKEEIKQLYTEGKITRPSKRPEVEAKEKVFDIPNGWTWTRLGNALALVNGRAYKKEELLDEGTPVMRIQNLGGGGSWYYSDLELPPEKYCHQGDLLYAWSGTFGPYIWDGLKAIFHYHIWRIELTKAITKKYAYHLLQAVSGDVEDNAHGIMLPHMTKGGMEKLAIPLPPREEQQRIVATVDRLMEQCDVLEAQLEREQALGEELLEAVLHGAARGEEKSRAPEPIAVG